MAETGYLLSESLLKKVKRTTRNGETARQQGERHLGRRLMSRYIVKITGKYTGTDWTPTNAGATYTGTQQITDINGDFADGIYPFGDEADSESFPPIIDLQSLSSYRDNKDNDDLYRIPLNSIVEVFQMSDVEGNIWFYTCGPANESFWAEITGTLAGLYSWTMLDDDAVTFQTVTGVYNAKEIQGRQGVNVGEIVRMYPDASVDNSLFCFVCHSANDDGSAQDNTYTGEHSEAARSGTSWRRASQGTNRGVIRTVSTGVSYYDAGDETLWGYVEDWEFDANGHLVSISDERRVTIEVPTTCSCV
jgi:hypothetical protein